MSFKGPSLCEQNMFLLHEFKLIQEGEKRKDAGVVMVLARASGDQGAFSCSATNGCGGLRQIILSAMQVPEVLLR